MDFFAEDGRGDVDEFAGDGRLIVYLRVDEVMVEVVGSVFVCDFKNVHSNPPNKCVFLFKFYCCICFVFTSSLLHL